MERKLARYTGSGARIGLFDLENGGLYMLHYEATRTGGVSVRIERGFEMLIRRYESEAAFRRDWRL